jgi:glutamate-1-semialdehyde 2,1-aminomutase
VSSIQQQDRDDMATGTTVGPRSIELFDTARRVFPGGTTRVTIERDPVPRYMSHGRGAYLFDVDGRRLLDLNGNYTTLIHGHAFEPVIRAVERQLRSGMCFADPTETDIALAELLCGRVPGLERIRFANTGTEAVMFAVKAARAYTGRSGIAKIEGAYHGAYDWVEVGQAATPDDWGPEDQPASAPTYRGVPEAVLRDVAVLRFNDPDGARRILTARARDLAAVVIDPMPSRAGLIAPTPDFIAAVQETARANDILIISDEVLNFRQSYHGASARYGIAPDLITLGKIIGGGLPIGAVGGRAEVMAVFDASGHKPALPQGGTFAANPLSMTAGLASMQALDHAAFAHLEALGDTLRARLATSIAQRQAAFCVTGAASLFRIHAKRRPPNDFREAFASPAEIDMMKTLSRFFAEEGIIIPSTTSASLCTAMTTADIAFVVDVFDRFLETHAARFAGAPS